MKTRLPFSTISFNTEPYLILKLTELRNAKILSDWFFIPHKAEDDECKGKEHFHVFMIPSKGVQTDDIRQELKEFDPTHPDKPRGTLAFRFSKFGSWYLYAIHDHDYLASKGESRKFHYCYDDLRASDPDVLYEYYYEIDVLEEIGAFKGMKEAKSKGLSFSEFFNQGKVPVAQVNNYLKSWELILIDRTDRGDHLPHAVMNDQGDLVDPVTGEILSPEEFSDAQTDERRPSECLG